MLTSTLHQHYVLRRLKRALLSLAGGALHAWLLGHNEPQADPLACPYCRKVLEDRPELDRHAAACRDKGGLISVVVPCRVGEKIRTLPSLARQTYRNLEIIIEYDTEEKGASHTRNLGARKAQGDYLFFCDNDLELHPDCLANLYLTIKQSGKKWVFGKFIIDGILFNEGRDINPPQDPKSLIDYFYCVSTMSLIERSIAPVFDNAMRKYEDWDLWVTLAERGYWPAFCDHILFSTLNRPGGVCEAGSGDNAEWIKKLYRKHGVDLGSQGGADRVAVPHHVLRDLLLKHPQSLARWRWRKINLAA